MITFYITVETTSVRFLFLYGYVTGSPNGVIQDTG